MTLHGCGDEFGKHVLKQVIESDVLVVGAGHAGAQSAIALRQKGFGGSILVVGDEQTLPYERPPLSKAYFTGTMDVGRLLLRSPDYWIDHNVDLILNRRVTRLEAGRSEAWLDDDSRVAFKWCVLATGGRLRRLTCRGANLPGVHYLRTVAHVDAIRSSLRAGATLVVIGAGYVGLEIAAAAREMGHDVAIVESQARVLSRVTSPIVSNFYERRHRARGVKLHLGAQVVSIDGAKRAEQVRLASGESLTADLVIAGIGIDAEDTLAADAEIRCDNGILVDECFRTSVPNILAVGDCARHPNVFADGLWRLESVQHAVDSAEIAADVICGAPRRYCELPTFWSEQYDLRLQTAGIAKNADEIVVRGDPQNGPFTAIYLDRGRIIAVDAINNSKDFIAARALIRNGIKPDPAKLADPSVPMKSLAQSAA